MSNRQSQPQLENLQPIATGERVFSLSSYMLMMWASLIVVQAFVLGQALLPPQGTLTLLEGVVVILASTLTMAAFIAMNGHAGLKYGIPYCIQVRAAFGIRGARFPEVLRLFPAIVWYGFGTWIAALSADGIVRTLTGFSPSGITYVYFVVLQAAQTWLAYRGVRMMKWFNVGASVALVLIMGYMLTRTLEAQSLRFASSWQARGEWGLPFWSGLNASIGILVAVMVSASDLTRYMENRQSTLWWGNLLGVTPPFFFMMFFGFVA
ncbi:MAG: cytosine permease, partial [Gammaproteobacteria bacterium]|nr:cytosine permease [Gammaproteobacteria bacterium]